MSCCEKDPQTRYQHAAEVRADLKRLKRELDSGRAIAPEPAPVRPRSRQSPKPKRARTDTPRSGRAKAPGSGARVVEPLAPTRNRWIRRVWPAAAALALLSVVAGLFYVLGSRRDSVTVGIALEKFGRAVELSPTAFIYSYHGRAWAYGMLGRYDESLEEERKFVEALTRQPRTDTFDRDFLEGRLLDAYLLSRTGRYREAQARIADGLRTTERIGHELGGVSLPLLAALLREERGDRRATLDEWARVRRQRPQLSSATRQHVLSVAALSAFEGMARARAGELVEARALLTAVDRPESGLGPNRAWLVPALQGEIAFAAGDLAAAETAFITAEPKTKTMFDREAMGRTIFLNNPASRDGLARIKKARGDLRGAIDIYRKLAVPDISSKRTDVLQPLHVLELARLLDKSGDAAAAREQYRRFLELWKSADAGLPELAEVRRKLAAK